jgi:predicted secreted Zn-dependent protease
MGAAIISTVIGVVVVGSLAASGLDARSSSVAEPAASQTATQTAGATSPPAPSPTQVAPTPVASAVPTASPSPIAITVSLPELSPKVVGAKKVRYFAVKGDSPAALLDNTVLRSKASCKSTDTLACVFTRPNIRWTERTRLATGACTIVAPKVSYTSTVYLPRWVSPQEVRPELLAWWTKMVDHMAWHEGQHIKIHKSYDAKLKRLMVGHKCSSADKIVDTWERTLKAAQDKFDAKDALWRYPEYPGPGGWFGTVPPS